MEKHQEIKLLSSTLTCFYLLKYKASLIMANRIIADSFFHFIRLLRNHMQELWLGQSSLASYHNMGL